MGLLLQGASASSGSVRLHPDSFPCHTSAHAGPKVTTFTKNFPPLFAKLSASNPATETPFSRGSQCVLIQTPQ